MSIITIKVLRTISKIVLLIVGIGIIGYGGLMVYKSVVNKPQRVRITNVTDSAATITWVTDNPVRGVVYYKDEGSFLPGPLGFLGSKVAYDDRDFARAQDECVTAFNENAKNTKDEDFAVDGNNFDCENIPVEKLGAYYTHSVTIKDLDDSSTYFFVVGNGIWSWKASSESITTFENLESIETPLPIFGRVSGDDESFSNDALVYVTFTSLGNEQENKVTESILYSSTTNEDGGWYVDASSIRDSDGNVLPLELGNDLFEIQAIYSNYGESEGEGHVFGYFETTVFDIIVEKSSDIKSATNKFIFNSYACDYSPSWLCDGDTIEQIQNGTANCDEIGPGNCLKVLSGNDKELDANEKKKIIESGAEKYGVLVNDLDYVANIQKICNCDDGEVCKNGECVVTVPIPNPVNGGVVLKFCIDDNGKKIHAGSRCLSGGTCDGRTGDCSGVERGRTSKYCLDDDGKTILAGRSCPLKGGTCNGATGNCSGGTDDGPEEEELNEETCKIIPDYRGSFIADIGANAGKEYQTLHSCKACEVSIDAYPCTKKYGVPNIKYVGSNNETSYNLNISELDKVKLLSAQPDNGVSMVDENPTLETSLENELKEIYEKGERIENVGSDNIVIGIGMGYQKKVTAYCNALGLKLVPASGGGKMCGLDDDARNLKKFPTLFFGAYAQDSASDGYTVYLPEYGMYSFELGDYNLKKETTNGNTYYIFYIETNDKKGFQMPADPDNPTEKEDIMLKSSSTSITYEKVSSAQSYTLVKGINLVSFNFVPVSTDLGPLTAKGVIEEAAKKDVTIQYISSFDGGRWSKGYTCKDGKCSGNDFNILPGKGYLVYVIEGGEMSIGGYELKSSVPVNLSGGWNLVGIHGYTTAYTARTLIDSMSKIDGVTANNVTWWPTSKGMYEGLQVTGEQEYGFDFPISPTNGYFVRISSFKPEDSKCKSLLWNEGGTLNGACGITK